MINRAEAWNLLNKYTQSESLIKHALSVEAGMSWYADYFNVESEQKEQWAITGLIHDFDYEQYPEPNPKTKEGHPYAGNQILIDLNYPENICSAVMGHALFTEVPRETQMAKTLFAVDELSGLITACALVRPDKSLSELKLKSVKKKFKNKSFAAGCNREEMLLGAEELGIEFDTHIENVIAAMKIVATDIGLNS